MRQCAACGVLGTTKRCACQGALYCGEICQKQSWKEHKKKCTWSLELLLKNMRRKHGVDHAICFKANFELGEIYIEHAQYERAEAHFLEGRRIFKLHVGDDHAVLSESGRRLGQVYLSQEKYDEAGMELTKSVRVISTALQGASEVHITSLFETGEGNANDVTFVLTNVDLAHTIGTLARVYSLEGNNDNCENFKKTELLYLEALEIYRTVEVDGDDDVSQTLCMLGSLYETYPHDDDSKALVCYAEALNLMRLPGKQPGSALACTLVSCAGLCLHQENFDEALVYIEEGIGILRGIHREKHPLVSCALLRLAEIYQGMGKTNESLRVFHKIVKTRVLMYGPDHGGVASCLQSIAHIHLTRGEGNLALVHFDKAQTIMIRMLGTEHWDVATGYFHIGWCKEVVFDIEGACRAYTQAHTIYSNMNTSPARERAICLSEYIRVLQR